MDLITKLRYQGYTSTPSLWKGNTASQFKQIELSCNSEIIDDSIVFKNKRLGKLVEEFVFHQLKQHQSITWICDNLQIQNGKQTIGEIDALYYSEEKPVHLEIVYKFYLYDTIEHYNEPLAYWIGPNRKDNLLYKLDKLHNKQFPLLHNDLTKTYLESYNLDVKTIKQELCFKAQLFLPYQESTIDISPLNRDCISGFYISYSKLQALKTFKFYIPNKLDWLVIPNLNVDWINYSSALEIIEIDINNKRSPLVWIKQNDEELSKCFITYW
ncbi:DUF1853 family protein [Winogradskyella sp.]|uniref:DUF1853 family protein n=1 Tax=Winogradskyella sp. TaxID=1883156 RepID=UPI0025F803C7|nr:DUF1853 family protein [Winogradskyella sp.]